MEIFSFSGLIVHRMTGSKETIDYLHKCNHSASYTAIRLQNQAWARMVITGGCLYPNMRKGVVCHSTLDNNDGRQNTLTGSGTTHDTNVTLFQIPSMTEETLPTFGEQIEFPLAFSSAAEDLSNETSPYMIEKKVEPPLFKNHVEMDCTGDLERCLRKDIAWSVAGCVADISDDFDPLGSWTAFNKQVIIIQSLAVTLKFLYSRCRL